jgi:hypothetical protein
VRTDLLDLRSWRWRSGAFLQRQPGSSADDDEGLLNMGVVMHEGQVLAIGGRHYWKVRGLFLVAFSGVMLLLVCL